MKIFDAFDLIELVSWIQMKNHRAYLSHRKFKMAIAERIPYVQELERAVQMLKKY